jgi:hypothetical protein
MKGDKLLIKLVIPKENPPNPLYKGKFPLEVAAGL